MQVCRPGCTWQIRYNFFFSSDILHWVRQIRISGDLDVQSTWSRWEFSDTNYKAMLPVPKNKKRCGYWDQHLEVTGERWALAVPGRAWHPCKKQIWSQVIGRKLFLAEAGISHILSKASSGVGEGQKAASLDRASTVTAIIPLLQVTPVPTLPTGKLL